MSGNPYGGPGKKGRPLSLWAQTLRGRPIRHHPSPLGGRPRPRSAPPSQRLNCSEFCPNADKDFEPVAENSLDSLKKLLRDCRTDIPENLPPMAAGLIGYMGYDMVRLMEKLPDENPDAIGLPDSYFMRPRIMVIFDSI